MTVIPSYSYRPCKARLPHITSYCTLYICNRIATRIEKFQPVQITVNEINDIVSVIAASIDEQSETTKEISTNMQTASKGVSVLNQGISHTSKVTEGITQEIAEANQSLDEISTNSSKLYEDSSELAKLAQQLTAMVERTKGLDQG